MKKWLTLLFSLSISLSAFTQWSASVGTNQGYEWNIFKNPDLFVQSADTMFREDMWQNSVFSEGFISIDGRFPIANGRLKFSADVSNNFYYQQQNAQKLFFKIRGSYRVKYARRKYFEIDPSFSRRLQDGVDQNDLVFSTRLSYQQIELPIHADFYMGEKAWLKFDLRYRNRVFDVFQNRQTVFHSYFFQSEYKKRWEGLNGWEKELAFEGSVEYRDQELISTGQTSSAIHARQFLITNFRATPSIGRISDRLNVSIPINAVLFKDQLSGSLDYLGWSSALEIESEFQKWGYSIEAEYGNRLFRNFTVDSGSILQYTILNLSGTAKYVITPNLEFEIKGRYLLRDSSRDRISTTAYRGFQTSYIQTGFKVKL